MGAIFLFEIKNLDLSWQDHLGSEFKLPYMINLHNFLNREYLDKKVIFPNSSLFFKALELTPLEAVKVVILGQDPYHGFGQASGLSFSVPHGALVPPSLLNIFKELKHDLGYAPCQHGCLEYWAKQGVLLLNTVLSVEAQKPGSHRNQGWERFTDKIIGTINQHGQPTVFAFWGAFAKVKASLISEQRHKVIRSAHPSPLSAYRGFLGSRPFSQINAFLTDSGILPIDWQLPQ